MLKVFGVIGAFLVIILVDIFTILKTDKRKKTVLLYSALMLMGFIISILLALDKAPTSPAVIIGDVITSFLGSEI